jgi:integrase
MARTLGKLNNLQVKTARSGVHADGGGLYLQVRESLGPDGKPHRTRSWIYRYTVDGRQTWLGLGAYPDVSLAMAREKATDARRLRADGKDPLEQKRVIRAALRHQKPRAPSFDRCAAAFVESHGAAWRNPKRAQYWTRSLGRHVYPVIGKVLVSDVDTALVMRVLEPIWRTKTETAVQLRGWIEAILNWAAVMGYRSGDNPARWRGHLDHLLPSPRKIAPQKHHPALPWIETPNFMLDLKKRDAMAARALEFLILTACRSGEVLGACWNEIDFTTRVWTIPPERTKAFREHRVPLSDAALTLLAELPRRGEHVFAGRNNQLNSYGMRMLLLHMKRHDITPHGFRATFRTWAGDETPFARETVEAALGHIIGDRTEQAYSRGDALEKRRKLMNAWGAFLSKTPARQGGAVVALRVAS